MVVVLLVATGDELAGALRYGTLLLLSNHFLGGYNPIFWPDHMLSIIIIIIDLSYVLPRYK